MLLVTSLTFPLKQLFKFGLLKIFDTFPFAPVLSTYDYSKMEAKKQLEAFSIQLVILAIWKQALHMCHTQAASAMEGCSSQETTKCGRSTNMKHGSSDSEECLDGNVQGPKDILSQIESEFLREIDLAEELAKDVEPGMTLIFDLST